MRPNAWAPTESTTFAENVTMPKIDPHTGCEVMTTPEFWASEARSEGLGRSGAELQSDFMDELADDLRAEESRLREGALGTLQEAVREWNEADPEESPIPLPEVILDVLEAHVRASFRSSGFSLKARVRATGGLVGVLSVTSESFAGSWAEPPDYEINVIWEG